MLFQFGQWHWKQEPILIPLNSLVQSTDESCNKSAVTIRTIALKTRAVSHSSEFFSAKHSQKLEYKCSFNSDDCTENKNRFLFHRIPSAKHSRKLQYKCCYNSDYCTQKKSRFSFHCFLLCETVERCNITAVSLRTNALKTKAHSPSTAFFSANSRKLQYNCCFNSDDCTENKSRFSSHCL